MNHVKDYYDHFGYTRGDFIPCELTGLKYQDIHHIEAKRMGGRSDESHVHKIENLMALTRRAHEFFGDKEQWMQFLIEAHLSFMETGTPWVELYPGSRELQLLYGKRYDFSEYE